MTLRNDTPAWVTLLSAIGWMTAVGPSAEAQVSPAASAPSTTAPPTSTPDARRSGLDLEEGEDDGLVPFQPGSPITLDVSLPGEKRPLRGHNRQFTLWEGLGARDLKYATRENKVVFYVDPVPVPLSNPSPKPGLPDTIWDIKGHDDPDASSVEVTFLLRLYSPLMADSARAWLRTHHLANSFSNKPPRETPGIEVRNLQVRNIWVGVGREEKRGFRVMGEGLKYIKSMAMDEVEFRVDFRPDAFARYLALAARGEVEYKFLVQPIGQHVTPLYKESVLTLDIHSQLEEFLGSGATPPPGTVVFFRDQKYLTQHGRHLLTQKVAARADVKAFVDADVPEGLTKFALADPISLNDWLQAQTIAGEELQKLWDDPQNRAFAEWLVPNQVQLINRDAAEKGDGTSEGRQKTEGSTKSLGLAVGAFIPPVGAMLNGGLSFSDQLAQMNSKWAFNGTKWEQSKTRTDFVPVELTVYKVSSASQARQLTATTSVSVGRNKVKGFVPYSTMSSKVTPGRIDAALARLRDESLGYPADRHIDVLNEIKAHEQQLKALATSLTKKTDHVTFEKLQKIVGDLATSDAMTTEVVWKFVDVMRPSGAVNVDFGRPVLDAVAFVGESDYRKGRDGTGDVHYVARVNSKSGNVVVVEARCGVDGGNMERVRAVVVARVRR